MGYPSLLYKSAPKLSPMELTVFEDLQLLNEMYAEKGLKNPACIIDAMNLENILRKIYGDGWPLFRMYYGKEFCSRAMLT